MKIKAEMNEIQNRKTIEKIIETKSLVLWGKKLTTLQAKLTKIKSKKGLLEMKQERSVQTLETSEDNRRI